MLYIDQINRELKPLQSWFQWEDDLYSLYFRLIHTRYSLCHRRKLFAYNNMSFTGQHTANINTKILVIYEVRFTSYRFIHRPELKDEKLQHHFFINFIFVGSDFGQFPSMHTKQKCYEISCLARFVVHNGIFKTLPT